MGTRLAFSGKPLCFAAFLSLAMIAPSHAATNTWTGTGNWTNSANWSAGHVPIDSEDVAVNGNVMLTNSSATLASFTVYAGKTNTFGGWSTVLTAGVVNVYGTITHTNNSATSTNGAGQWVPDSRVYVHCATLFVANNGSINVSAKGYLGAVSALTNGCGPGGGLLNSAYGSAGYGGIGATVSGANGQTYGSVTNPVDPGSGGGFYGGYAGGNGGGAVLVEATGRVTVNGSVMANGGAGVDNNGNGASGGSIFITCATFDGTNGLLSAMGGSSATYSGSSGGGGRIAVVYTDAVTQASMSVPSVRFSTAPGLIGVKGYGDIGTLYFPDNRFLAEMIPHSGQWMVPGLTNWSPNNLTISNAWFRFPASDFSLTVTNAITVLGGNMPLNRLDLTPLQLSCGGDLVLTNISGVTTGSWLYLLASTNSIPAADGCGPRVGVGGTLIISSNSVLYPYSHSTNGCGIGFQVQNLTIAGGGSLNANGLGCRGGTNNTDHGKGVGGTLSGKTVSGGAGYGGTGGNGNGGVGGIFYGSSNAPVDSGSGSGNSTADGTKGFAGGGLVRLVVTNRVVLDGTITANGTGNGAGNYGGGGSGGGIYISCYTFAGRGKLLAQGGASGQFGGGSGAGGRIAVWRAADTATLSSTNVASPTGVNGTGQTGTVVWITTSAAITNVYATNVLATTAVLLGNLTSTGMAPVTVYCYWGTNDGGSIKSAWTTNIALPGIQLIGPITNSVSGLTPGTAYSFRFVASNAFAETWADPAGLFSTAGGGLVLDNDGGATNITCTSATLQGQVLIANPTPNTYVCWGTNNPMTDATGAWNNVISVGPQLGPFSTGITGLTANQTYYYRCYAVNVNGDGWAPSATNFAAASPSAAIADASVVKGALATTTDALFSVTLALPSATDVPISFITSNGTATAGSDYVATNGTLVIAAGATTGVIRVTVIGNNIDEYPGESFFVVLTNAPNAVLTRTVALGWIVCGDLTVETKTWSGAGNWNSVTNWQPVSKSLPGPSDTVIIPGGTSCTLTNSAMVTSITVSNTGTLTLGGWATALTTGVANVYGTITHLPNSDTNGADGWQPDNRAHIVCGSLFIASNGAISANAKGYLGGVSGAAFGRGPGGGLNTNGRGGGYGGAGGGASGGYGQTYGSPSAPTDPGSGGSYQGSSAGGNGGGVIWIEAAAGVTVNGSVTANGGAGSDNNDGGGSGGSVYITCGTFDGTNGLVSAIGGNSATYSGYSGGGGRIAVIYTNTAAQWTAPVPGVRFSTAPGLFGNIGLGDIGTLYFPDNRFLTETIPHSGQWMVSGFTNWSPNNLTVSNAWIRFPAPGLALTITNTLTVMAGNAPLNRLEFTPTLLTCGGDLVLTNMNGVTNGAYLLLLASSASPAADGCGPRVVVSGTLNVAGGSKVFPYSNPTNGCSVGFQVQNLMIASNGAINADGLGFRGGTNGADGGKGLGGSLSVTAGAGSGGGGYGGVGGNGYSPSQGGQTYGSSNAPVDPGSGSGYSGGGPNSGYAGGGLIRMSVADQVLLNGAISANGGGNPAGSFGGGGSGGGIYLSCTRLAGSGSLSANGGPSSLYGNSGGGGGGRIAVWTLYPHYTGTAVVNGGVGSDTNGVRNGQVGTIFWHYQSPGTVFTVR